MDGRPLWAAEDQQERLAELTASTDDTLKELPLRRDVRSLGILLGRVLVEQAGQELFEVVEDLRKKFIAHRDRKVAGSDAADPLLQQAKEIVASLDATAAYRVSKAFSAYFELTNLAETASGVDGRANSTGRKRRWPELFVELCVVYKRLVLRANRRWHRLGTSWWNRCSRRIRRRSRGERFC
jgi:hypothetical protein